MSKKCLVIFWVVLLVGGIVLMAGLTPAVAENTIKVGSIWGLSGPGSQLGVIMKDGVELAADWLNKKGGITIKGQQYKIKLLIEDNKNSAAGSAGAATKLVHRDKVKFITGMNVPFQVEAVQSVTEKNGVILVAGKLSNLKPQDKFTFSGTQGFTVPIPNLYQFLKDKYPSVKTVGFTAHDEPGALATLNIARMFGGRFGHKLYEPVLTQFGSKEYYPTWTKLLKDKPDAVDIGISFPDSLAANARHGRELGFKGPIVTVGTGDAMMFIQMIGKKGATDYIFAGYDMNDPNNPPMVKKIMKLWGQKYNKPFNLDALDAFSGLWVLAQAIEKAQSLDPAEVAKTWAQMTSIETPSGTGTMGGAKTFGINHMVLAPAPVSRLLNGKVDSTTWYKSMLP